MSVVPNSPKIYHITHCSNLPSIIGSGMLWSDARRIELGLNCAIIGLSSIKRRRLEELPVTCHPGTRVGEYVPFYFCPRSVMLYILHVDNHPELAYHGGQEPIVHLVADLGAVVEWAEANNRRWTFSDRNAGARYAGFFARLDDLGKINWKAVQANNWQDPALKEGKQAEFLVHESFPWQLIERIGVLNGSVKASVEAVLAGASHRPPVTVERAWYY